MDAEERSSTQRNDPPVERQLEQLCTCSDIVEATEKIEALLNETPATIEELEDGHEDSHGRRRVVVEDENILFLKTLRENGNNAVLDMLCELVAYRICERFGAPVADTSLVDTEAYGPALALPYLESDLRHIDNDLTDIAPAHELGLLYTLELWLQNYDDKDRHFRVKQMETGNKLRFIDHGHALYRNWIGNIEDPSDVLEFDPQNNAGDQPEKYGIHRVKDIAQHLDLVEEITDEQCGEFVDWALHQLDSVEDKRVENFLGDKEFHRGSMVLLLKKRRDKIYEMADERLS